MFNHKVCAPGAALGVVVLGCLGLAGWVFDNLLLKKVLQGLPAMEPNTALALTLAGCALWLMRIEVTGHAARAAAQLLGFGTTLIGLLTLAEYLFNWNPGIDQVLFGKWLTKGQIAFAGRPAFITALNLTLLGLALLFLPSRARQASRTVELLSVTALLISLLALIGHACNVPLFYGRTSRLPNTGMALHELAAFLALSAGVLCARADSVLMKVVTSRTSSGVMARRLLLAPVFIPLMTGWVKMAGQKLGFDNPEFAGWLFAFLNIFIFTLAIWWSARLLYDAEIVRSQTEAELQSSRAELERRVTERTAALSKATAEAEAIRQELQLIFDTVPAIIFYKDREHRHGRVNQTLARLHGLPKEAIEGRTDKDMGFVHADLYYRDDEEVVKSGQAKRGIVEPVETAAGTRWLQTDKLPSRDESGRITGVIGFAIDITERKQAEEALRELNAELERRVGERTAELEAANKELEAFSYSVSHDLRAPLRHIDGFVGLLRKSAGAFISEQSRGHLETIADSAKQMGRLIDDLLGFSRMSRAELRRSRVNLQDLLEETLEKLEPEIKGRQILWERGALPVVEADPAMLRQVLVNLVSNAIKYTRPRDPARIEIGSIDEKPGEVVVFVRDNGVGFDMDYASKLFGVFQRLHFDEDFEGTGIGLANVRRIVARHGGRTWAEGKVDEGATFYFSLPRP